MAGESQGTAVLEDPRLTGAPKALLTGISGQDPRIWPGVYLVTAKSRPAAGRGIRAPLDQAWEEPPSHRCRNLIKITVLGNSIPRSVLHTETICETHRGWSLIFFQYHPATKPSKKVEEKILKEYSSTQANRTINVPNKYGKTRTCFS